MRSAPGKPHPKVDVDNQALHILFPDYNGIVKCYQLCRVTYCNL